ncbi:MAG: HD domain-containing phosphohydrolase [Desulfovibrionaceae bacterium]
MNTSSSARKHARIFIYILCVIILGAAALIVQIMLASAYADMRTSIERRLYEQVQPRSAAIAAITGNLIVQVRNMANTDLIRLFTFEIYADAKDGSGEEAPTLETEKLHQQIPVMRKLLSNFARENNVVEVTLLTANKKVAISSLAKAPQPTKAQWEGAARVLEKGEVYLLPMYRNESALLLGTIFYPVFPPLYIAEKNSKPMGVLMVSCDLSGVLRELPPPNPFTGEQWRLLQKTDTSLQEVSPLKNISINPFPRWYVEGASSLPFGLRSLVDNSFVYSLAVGIVNTPILLSYEIQQSRAEEGYAQYKQNLLLLMGICLVCVFLLIGMAWWWLMGQREKAVTVELHTLYKKVNAQRQLLNKVNSAVPAGIVLKDLTGKIAYANLAFAEMVGQSPEALLGQYHESIISALSTVKSLNPQTTELLKTGKSTTYTETLIILGEKRIYQVLCSPLRAEGTAITDVVVVYRDISDIMKAHEKSQHLTQQMVTVLLRSLETVDPYLSGQSTLSADLAQRLASLLGLEAVHIATVRAAASLSQLGMLHLPASLRTKEGALTVEEREAMHKHVEYTRAVLADIDFGVPVQDAIYQMYECMDGTGYPKGLRGAEIRIDARILCVANTFCALMRPRSYRKAHNVQEALDILSGPHFDTEITGVLKTFLSSAEGQDFLKRCTAKA